MQRRGGGERAKETLGVAADGGVLAGFGGGLKGGFAEGFQFGEFDGLALAGGEDEEVFLRGEGHGRGGMAGGEGFGEGEGVGVGGSRG